MLEKARPAAFEHQAAELPHGPVCNLYSTVTCSNEHTPESVQVLEISAMLVHRGFILAISVIVV